MNQAYCPECQTEMTKSIVGYLCHGCGYVHGFEKMPTSGASSGSHPAKKVAPTAGKTSGFARDQPDMHPATKPKSKNKSKSKLTHPVKKFVVPQIATESELPKPTDEEHMLPAAEPEPAEPIAPMFPAESAELIAFTPSAKSPSAPKAPKEDFVPPAASKAMKEEFSADDAGSALGYDKSEATAGVVAPATGAQSYLLPAIAGVLVVGALIIAFLVIR